MTTYPTTLAQDEVRLLLKDARRRRLIRTLAPLKHADEDRLAEIVASHEHPRPDATYVRSVELSLTHIHLPMLEDFEVIERTDGAVEPTLLVDTLDAVLDNVEQMTVWGGDHV